MKVSKNRGRVSMLDSRSEWYKVHGQWKSRLVKTGQMETWTVGY